MEHFKNDLRIGTLMARGIIDPRLLKTNTELDEAIIRLALRTLRKAYRAVFFLAYDCVSTWDEILELIHERLDREYELETIKKYAREIIQKIASAAETAEEISQWQEKYLRSQKNN